MCKKKRRLKPSTRRDEILTAALELAETKCYTNITREEIANRAQVSVGLVTKYFGTMDKLKRSVMRAAIHKEILSIIAHGVAVRDPHALKAPKALISRAVSTLSNP